MGKLRIVLAIAVVLAVAPPSHATSGTISTFAGGGRGDGGSARAAELAVMFGLAQDGAGNMYVAETFGHRIRKITPAGTISTVAGTGESRSSGDGGPAAAAGIWEPVDVVIGPDGDLYVGESSGRRVRRIDAATGIIATVAGTGSGGALGDGGPATSASITPRTLIVDGDGNIFIGEAARVRRVDAATGIISTVAGTTIGTQLGDGGPATSATFRNVDGLALDSAGNLYIADAMHYRVRKVDAATGIITTIAGNGEYCCVSDGRDATATSISYPGGMAFDSAGNLFMANYYVVLKLDAQTNQITIVAGNGAPNSLTNLRENAPARMTYIRDARDVILTSAGVVFIDNASPAILRSVDSLGLIHTLAGTATFTGDGGPATSANLNTPGGTAMDAAGNVYVADAGRNVVRKIDPSGTITRFAGGGSSFPSLNYGDGGAATSAVLDRPTGVDVDAAGNVYIADTFHARVRKVDQNGNISTTAGPNVPGTGNELGFGQEGLGYVYDVAVASNGDVYIAALDKVWKASPSGAITVAAGGGNGGLGDGGPAALATLNQAQGVALDEAGNLFVADTRNHRIRRVDALTGIITTVAGTSLTYCYPNTMCGDGGPATAARLSAPVGVDVAADGTIYIADSEHHLVRAIRPDGIIVSVAGIPDSRSGLFFGDGGAAIEAAVSHPTAVEVTALGLLISDTGNGRLRLSTI